jgi:ATPase subunit of ABC transporter with duplicated ATPase domains
MIAGMIEPDRGKITMGHEVTVGTCRSSTTRHRVKADFKTAFEWLYQWDEKSTVQEIRGLLGRMLFPSEDADKPVSALSGGETVASAHVQAHAHQANLLLLDEPTNHLDLESIRALTEAMQRTKARSCS